jgi:type I restriction enzyme R subunit
MARNVFKKYKALFPEKQAKKHTADYDAIQAIYRLLNKKVKNADVTAIMKRLQEIVDDSVAPVSEIFEEKKEEVYYDLSKLDFDKLKQAFAKAPNKNTITYTLQEAVEKQLEQMLKENPLRVDFYNRYQEIIKEYNKGKTMEDTVKAFEDLTDFIGGLSDEEQRAKREDIESQEILAIYDLLCDGKELTNAELKVVKKVAKETLDTLKADKLKVALWRESRQVTAQVRTSIYGQLLHLPKGAFTDEEVGAKTVNVYQHIYTNYYGDGKSVYQESA